MGRITYIRTVEYVHVLDAAAVQHLFQRSGGKETRRIFPGPREEPVC